MYNFIHVSNSLYKRKKSEVFYTEILIDQRVYSLVVQKQEVITNRKELSDEITSKTFVPIPFISPSVSLSSLPKYLSILSLHHSLFEV